MTDRETIVTEDLREAIKILDEVENRKGGKTALDIVPATAAIERAISKIHHLRSEATVQLDKL